MREEKREKERLRRRQGQRENREMEKKRGGDIE